MKQRCKTCHKWFALNYQKQGKYNRGVRTFVCSLPCQIAWMNSRRPAKIRDSVEKLARQAVYLAVKRGDMTRPDVCDICKQPPEFRIEAHHYLGYENKLAVQWLCVPCHSKSERSDLRRGENNGRAVLSEKDVRRIRELVSTHTNVTLAARYGVGESQISRIRHGVTWEHVS